MALLLRLSAAFLAAALLAPAAAHAVQDQKRLDRTVRYLQDVQHRDGGFGERGSEPGFSTWAAYALAAAGINPLDQKRKGGVDVYTYLTRHTSDMTETTEFARLVLVATASGRSPQRFGPIDPLKRMLALQLRDGAFPQPPYDGGPTVNGTAFAVLAMAGIEAGALAPAKKVTMGQVRARSDQAADWLLANQGADGSWDGVDLTAASIEALNAAGRRGTAAQNRALRYIRSRQNADGGFGQGTPGESSNSASTSWVARALAATRVDARSWRTGPSAGTPLDYLASMQQSDGSVRYSATEDTNRIWMTSYTAPALAGASLPVAAVEREEKPQRQPQEDDPATTRGDDAGQPGAGGTADGGDGDVTAGGGGEGADLFSRPRPGSRGSKAGGDRDTERSTRSKGEGQGAVAGESVAGKLVGRGQLAATGEGKSLGTAPGLRTAAAGGDAPPWLMAAIGAGLLLSALGGVYLERRRGKGHTL